MTVLPAPTETAAAEPSSTASPSPLTGVVEESPTAEPTQTAAAKPTASTTKTGTNRLTRLIELLLAAAVLLGVGGAYGLYATSDKR